MSIQTLSPEKIQARRTTVAMKLLMAVTGAVFVFFVLFHMYGNLKAFQGQAEYDTYAHHLRTFGQPILPYKGFLWAFRAMLIVCVIVHAYSAFWLWGKAHSARTTRYAVKLAGAAAWRSTAMRWGGVTLIFFLVFHLIEFTTNKVNLNSAVSATKIGDSPFQLLVASFQLWWLVVIYLVALSALGLHLHHGVWSACQTMGVTTSPAARRWSKAAATTIAIAVAGGFALVPVFILFGIVK